VSTTAGEPQRDRAREASAHRAFLHYLYPQLAPRTARNTDPAALITRWTVRGQPRTRARFADPHPDDFPGGLPLPGEYPILKI
jgi:hypothetical protein